MKIQSIIENYGVIISIIGLLGIEIAPIKINPLSMIGKFVGGLLGIDEIKHEVRELKSRVDCNDINTIRSRIVCFDNVCRNKKTPIKYYQYKTCFEDIKKWQEYHKEYPELNGMIDIAIKNIEETFKKEKFSKEELQH